VSTTASRPARLQAPNWFGFTATLLLLLGLVLLPEALQGRSFELRLLTVMFLYAVLGHGWNILGGFAGQTSIGHGVFFGLGAYASTLLHLWYGLNPWLGMVAGAAVAAAFGVLIGLPCFRLRGHYFVIATLVVVEIMYQLFAAWSTVGGASGLSIPVAEAGLASFQFHRDRTPYYYIALAMLTGVTALVWWLSRSRLGYILQAIRDDEEALRSLGFSPSRYKLIAMAMSAAIVGAGGGVLRPVCSVYRSGERAHPRALGHYRAHPDLRRRGHGGRANRRRSRAGANLGVFARLVLRQRTQR